MSDVEQMKVNVQFYQINDSEKRMVILQGGTRCFHPNTMVDTPDGTKPIYDIEVGDLVNTPNGLKPVTGVNIHKTDKRCILVQMKDGTVFTATEDHLFWFNGEWVQLKDIVKEWIQD